MFNLPFSGPRHKRLSLYVSDKAFDFLHKASLEYGVSMSFYIDSLIRLNADIIKNKTTETDKK